MSEINLDDGKIKFENEWYAADELAGIIQEKMKTGDMKFAEIATALEELNKTLENSHAMEIRLVITKDEYQKLKEFGGDDDRDAVRKAIMAAIGGEDQNVSNANQNSGSVKKKQIAIKCPGCKAPIKITSDDRPLVVECSKCGVSGRLTAQNKWSKI